MYAIRSYYVADTLDAYADAEKLLGLDLIVPVWTMGEISQELVNNVSAAVQAGTGLAGCHGGMCDSYFIASVITSYSIHYTKLYDHTDTPRILAGDAVPR